MTNVDWFGCCGWWAMMLARINVSFGLDGAVRVRTKTRMVRAAWTRNVGVEGWGHPAGNGQGFGKRRTVNLPPHLTQ